MNGVQKADWQGCCTLSLHFSQTLTQAFAFTLWGGGGGGWVHSFAGDLSKIRPATCTYKPEVCESPFNWEDSSSAEPYMHHCLTCNQPTNFSPGLAWPGQQYQVCIRILDISFSFFLLFPYNSVQKAHSMTVTCLQFRILGLGLELKVSVSKIL